MLNRPRVATVAFSLLFATTLFAQVTITSITPSVGPSAGGTEVVIRGSGFTEIIGSPSRPPSVFFGGTYGEVRGYDETTLRVVTPPHLPGTVPLSVSSGDGDARLADAFTFVPDLHTGDDHFERLLLPLLIPPVRGAAGSEWHTELFIDHARNSTPAFQAYGLRAVCPPAPRQCGERDPLAPLRVPGPEVPPIRVEMTGTPGRFAYIPERELGSATMHLRIRDVTRDAENLGTEIPIVRERDFQERIVLIGVPTDARFRNHLRIYTDSNVAWPLRITVEGQQPIEVVATGGREIFEPGYASFTQFPIGTAPVRVTIEPTPSPLPVPPRIWAFITVTNNETQQVTIITPNGKGGQPCTTNCDEEN